MEKLYFTHEEKKQFLIKNGLEVETIPTVEHEYDNYGNEMDRVWNDYDIAYYKNSKPDNPTKMYHGIDTVFNRVIKEKLLAL